MSPAVPACRTVKVTAFRGDRSGPIARAFKQALDDQRKGKGSGPSVLDCLLHAGHAGVSVLGNPTIYGFNPFAPRVRICDLYDDLSAGKAFTGIVLDDTNVFTSAKNAGLTLASFEVILPEPGYLRFKSDLDAEIQNSKYKYGFPNGDGDCNCITWLERLGLPLLSGRVDEFVALPGFSIYPKRRFGECV